MFKPEKLGSKYLKETCKLFCLGYIKSFIYIFIKTFDDDKYKSEDDEKNKIKIIDVINGDNPIYKMMRIYIFKIFYNNLKIDIFFYEKKIEKYKIRHYKHFDKELNKIYKIDFEKTLKDDYYIDSYKIIGKYKKNEFKDKIKKADYDIEEYGIDNFYVLSYNNILVSYLQMENQKITKIFIQIYVSLYLKKMIYYSKQLNYSMFQINIIILKEISELILIILNLYYLVIVIV